MVKLRGQHEQVVAVVRALVAQANTQVRRHVAAEIAAAAGPVRTTAAHAAGAPEQGRSALDAVELTNHATQGLREHTPDLTRIHHVITAGGDAPNVVPPFAEVYYYIRHPQAEVVRGLYQRLVLCARAGALATETKLEIKFEGGIYQIAETLLEDID